MVKYIIIWRHRFISSSLWWFWEFKGFLLKHLRILLGYLQFSRNLILIWLTDLRTWVKIPLANSVWLWGIIKLHIKSNTQEKMVIWLVYVIQQTFIVLWSWVIGPPKRTNILNHQVADNLEERQISKFLQYRHFWYRRTQEVLWLRETQRIRLEADVSVISGLTSFWVVWIWAT